MTAADPSLLSSLAQEIERGLASVESSIVVAGAGAPVGLETALAEVRRIREAAEVVGLEPLLEVTIELELLLDRSARRAGVLTQSAISDLQVATGRLRELVKTVGDERESSQPVDGDDVGDETNVSDPELGLRRVVEAVDAAESESPQPLLDDEELDQVFRAEAREHLDGIEELLDSVATSRAALAEVRRRVHTLKGAAALAGFESVRQLAHRSEDLLELAAEVPAGREVPEAWCDWLAQMVQRLEATLDLRPESRDVAATEELVERLDDLLSDAARENPDASDLASATDGSGAADGSLDRAESVAEKVDVASDMASDKAGETASSVVEIVTASQEGRATARVAKDRESEAGERAEVRVEGIPPVATPPDAVADQRDQDEPAEDGPREALGDAETADEALGDAERELGPAAEAPPAQTDEPPGVAETEQAAATLPSEGAPGTEGATHRPLDVRISLDELDELERVLEELIGLRSVLDLRHSRLGRLSGELQRGGERLGELVHALRSEKQSSTEPSVIATSPRESVDSDEAGPDSEQRALHWRMLQEVVGDVGTSDRELAAEVDELRDELDRLGRLSATFQQQLLALRTVPVVSLRRRLERLVRSVAATRGKQVALEIEHGDTQMDRRVLDTLQESLQHLVVNAVEHGIENPELRRLRGKSREGRITITTRTEGTAIVLAVRDDGAGVDLDAVRRRAVEKGMLDPRAAERLGLDDALPLLFDSGFTTATHVGAHSGRGVGLDVVRACVERMGGRLDISSHRHEGTNITLWLPVHVAISRAMTVHVGDHEMRVPTVGLRRIVRPDSPSHPGPATADAASGEVVVNERSYPRHRLADLLGLESDSAGTALPLLIYELGELTAALEVDEVEDSAEIVTKPLPALLAGYPGVSGVTVKPDGHLVLMLDPPALLAESRDSSGAGERRPAEAPERTVLVVDDSLSVRRVLSRLLDRAGWSAVPARDGVEGIELLRALETRPVAMIVDIEMPRMNGYEFIAAVRERVEWEDVPILMLTSRSADEHREKAIDLGADRYLLKPLQRDLILQVLEHLVGHGAHEG